MLPAESCGVHAVETVESLREKAQQCWRLINATADEQTCEALQAMAEELEAAADAAEAKADPSQFLVQITEALKQAH